MGEMRASGLLRLRPRRTPFLKKVAKAKAKASASANANAEATWSGGGKDSMCMGEMRASGSFGFASG
jgi:hypothetical protein